MVCRYWSKPFVLGDIANFINQIPPKLLILDHMYFDKVMLEFNKEYKNNEISAHFRHKLPIFSMNWACHKTLYCKTVEFCYMCFSVTCVTGTYFVFFANPVLSKIAAEQLSTFATPKLNYNSIIVHRFCVNLVTAYKFWGVYTKLLLQQVSFETCNIYETDLKKLLRGNRNRCFLLKFDKK